MKTDNTEEVKQAQGDTQPGLQSVGFGWILTGYVVALIGGVLGSVFGVILYTSKKNMPNGQRGYRYRKTDRQHAMAIIVLGIVVTVVYSLIGVFSKLYG